MEELDATIIAELKEKAIERGDDDVSIEDNTLDEDVVKAPEPEPEPDQSVASAKPAPKKSKKIRSEKQKAAFEKARIARAENLRIKREIAAEKKAEKQKEKEAVQAEVAYRLKKHPKLPVPTKEAADRYLQQPTIPQAYEQQVVNNYYYYGEQFAQPKKKKGGRAKPKRPPTPSESESEEESGGANFIYSDEEEEEAEMPQSYKELQNYEEEVHRVPQEPEHPQLKFRFA